MLHDRFTSILGAKNDDDLRREIAKFGRHLGFDLCIALCVFEQADRKFVLQGVNNFPAEYLKFSSRPERATRDPCTVHAKRSSSPLLYDRSTFARVNATDMWEESAAFGLVTGMTIPIHTPDGHHFVFGLSRDRALPADQEEVSRIVGDAMLFANFAQQTMFSLWTPAPSPDDLPRLTRRELECLRWTMEGKTAWQVGEILRITERTANLHLHAALHKLQCSNKHQAVIKALNLGLIT